MGLAIHQTSNHREAASEYASRPLICRLPASTALAPPAQLLIDLLQVERVGVELGAEPVHRVLMPFVFGVGQRLQKRVIAIYAAGVFPRAMTLATSSAYFSG